VIDKHAPTPKVWWCLRHADGKLHLSGYWLDEEFATRYWSSREEAEAFAAARAKDGFKLLAEVADG